VALLAALWLVVVIASVALQFSLVARERTLMGMAASERTRDRAASSGALATVMARMDYDLRMRVGAQSNAAALRSFDPWLGADSIYSTPVTVGEVTVEVIATDLGARLNVNRMSETELRTLFGFVLRDYQLADQLAQSITDWIDADDLPRVAGGERDQYIAEGRLVLPNNGAFREVEDLIHVRGMTAEILAAMKPYLTTFGFSTRINVNTAPEAVLRAVAGMTDVVIANILAMRSAGRRIESMESISAAVQRAQPQLGGERVRVQADRSQQQLAARAGVDSRDLQLTLFVRDPASTQTARLVALVQRASNNSAALIWQQW
jgi:general secretion pathway protein K